MGKPKILLLETVSGEADRILAREAKLTDDTEVRAIITRGKGDVSAAVIDRYPKLEVIARCGVGLDNVAVDHATGKGIKVVNAPGVNAATVAEHTLLLMLALSRQLYTQVAAVKGGNWAARNHYGGDELRGKTLGIVGLGNIGKRVRDLAKAFGMKVIATRSAGKGFPLDELLETSDVVSLHLPLTKHTEGLIGKRELKLMKKSALLINTSRGAVIKQKALLKALEKGRIAGFAADVLAEEPPGRLDLVGRDDVLVTPHVASLTAMTYNDLCVVTVRNALDLLAGRAIDPHFIFNHDQ